jgi:ABC-type phosphate/phosphonate transport system substrate-binding protein
MHHANAQVDALASLPWYDLREIREATDTLWRAVARQFRLAGLMNVPDRLNRDVAYERQWTSPNFLFGQACGYDVRMAYADHLQVIATPCYGVPGCEGSQYSSFVVVREDARYEDVEDLRETRCVINTPTSHSGMNVLRALVAPLHTDGRFFSVVRMSGSHQRSLRMIQRGEVDVAAIDCVTHALLARHRPSELTGTRILHCTELVPAPPYVTATATPPEMLVAMREAVLRAMDDPSIAAAKSTLLLSGVEMLPDDAYMPIESLESLAQDHNNCEIPGRELATR